MLALFQDGKSQHDAQTMDAATEEQEQPVVGQQEKEQEQPEGEDDVQCHDMEEQVEVI